MAAPMAEQRSPETQLLIHAHKRIHTQIWHIASELQTYVYIYGLPGAEGIAAPIAEQRSPETQFARTSVSWKRRKDESSERRPTMA